MCGFLVQSSFEAINLHDLDQQLDKLAFRGMDARGSKTYQQQDGCTIYLGHRRLAINDLSSQGDQPLSYKHLHIVFNGEIYNFHQLKTDLQALGHDFHTNTDTEVFLIAYYEWGEAALAKFRGIFSAVIYNQSQNILIAIRDFMGVKPCFISGSQSHVTICSDLRALYPSRQRLSIRTSSLADFLALGFIPQSNPILTDIIDLPPGNMAIIDLNQSCKILKLKKYQPYEETIDESSSLFSYLSDAVNLQTISDRPVATLLSGGIDSGVISSLAARNSLDQPITAFTLGFSDNEFDESESARLVAQRNNLQHQTIFIDESQLLDNISETFDAFDLPYGDSSAICSSILYKHISKSHKVCLTGDGADELHFGYKWFKQIDSLHRLYRLPLPLRSMLSQAKPRSLRKCTIFEDVSRSFDESLFGLSPFTNREIFELTGSSPSAYRSALKRNFSPYPSNINDLGRAIQSYLLDFRLPAEYLYKADRCSMYYGVEARVPFLDQLFVKASLKSSPRSRGFIISPKCELKKIAMNYLPHQLISQKKKGFTVPLNKWLKGPLKEEVYDLVGSNISSNLFNREYALKVLDDYYSNASDGYKSNGRRIWLLYSLLQWNHRYVNLS